MKDPIVYLQELRVIPKPTFIHSSDSLGSSDFTQLRSPDNYSLESKFSMPFIKSLVCSSLANFYSLIENGTFILP